MSCKNLRGQLSLFAGGDLDDETSSALREHLKACPTCRNQVQTYEKTRSLLGAYGRQPAGAPDGPALWKRVMGRVGQKPLNAQRRGPPPRA